MTLGQDPELKAMNDVYLAVKDLDNEAIARILFWLQKKFNLNVPKTSSTKNNLETEGSAEITSFESVADFFAKASPKTNPEKILVVASYRQVVEGKKELTSRMINDELKNLGHGIPWITGAIDLLIDKKPALMIQIRKAGKTKQAQKKFKVTNEGINTVKEMLLEKKEEKND